ncbi:MAG: hypothetical protein PHN80_07670 [Hespellia sp.]|nr:hypothetical protein [Hespellia sp.]
MKAKVVTKTSIFPVGVDKVFELLQRLDTLQFIAKPYATFDPINNTSEKLQFSGVKTKICQGGYNENSHYRWKWFW